MEFKFGVRVGNLDEAVAWVEVATGSKSQARESSDLGGDYYAFGNPAGESARMFNNRDIYDDGPVIDGCDEWPVVLYIEGASSDTPAIQQLLKDTDHFVLVSSR